MHINELPAEIFDEILNTTKGRDVRKMVFVCKLWKKRILEEPRTPVLLQLPHIMINFVTVLCNRITDSSRSPKGR